MTEHQTASFKPKTESTKEVLDKINHATEESKTFAEELSTTDRLIDILQTMRGVFREDPKLAYIIPKEFEEDHVISTVLSFAREFHKYASEGERLYVQEQIETRDCITQASVWRDYFN